jgi:hypothetical protein
MVVVVLLNVSDFAKSRKDKHHPYPSHGIPAYILALVVVVVIAIWYTIFLANTAAAKCRPPRLSGSFGAFGSDIAAACRHVAFYHNIILAE